VPCLGIYLCYGIAFVGEYVGLMLADLFTQHCNRCDGQGNGNRFSGFGFVRGQCMEYQEGSAELLRVTRLRSITLHPLQVTFIRLQAEGMEGGA
jgi:hypothetical protein